jgi:hypothetical protein
MAILNCFVSSVFTAQQELLQSASRGYHSFQRLTALLPHYRCC